MSQGKQPERNQSGKKHMHIHDFSQDIIDAADTAIEV
jgi:hypothetical protein